jgi:hypothetical protein
MSLHLVPGLFLKQSKNASKAEAQVFFCTIFKDTKFKEPCSEKNSFKIYFVLPFDVLYTELTIFTYAYAAYYMLNIQIMGFIAES